MTHPDEQALSSPCRGRCHAIGRLEGRPSFRTVYGVTEGVCPDISALSCSKNNTERYGPTPPCPSPEGEGTLLTIAFPDVAIKKKRAISIHLFSGVALVPATQLQMQTAPAGIGEPHGIV